MPKIRVARTPGDAAKVDITEPLEIDIGKPDIEPTEIIYGKKKEAPPAAVKPSEPPPPPEEDADEPSLTRQVEQLKQSEEEARRRAAQVEQERNSYYQQAQRREQELTQLRSQTDGAYHETLVSSIAAAQSEVESAKQAYITARQANDYSGEAEAQDRLATARSRLVSLEAGKDELERRIKEPPQPSQHQVPLPSPSHVEQVLSQMPGLIDSERDYLRQHPDAVMDASNQPRLQAAYLDAQRLGLSRGSKDYFKFFDERLGYQSPREARMADEEEDTGPPVSAPVSRSAPGSRQSDSRIVLTPSQREAARWAGVDEFEYAKGLLKLRQAKQDDKERYGG